jgi:hypothetical protein
MCIRVSPCACNNLEIFAVEHQADRDRDFQITLTVLLPSANWELLSVLRNVRRTESCAGRAATVTRS